MKRRFLWLITHTLNRFTARVARSGRGPFALVRHVGRKSGTTYETPLILATVPEGFIAELTYGESVDWYRNVVAAGRCSVLVAGRVHRVVAIEPFGAARGYAAFGFPARFVLKLLRRREFRLLRTSPNGEAETA